MMRDVSFDINVRGGAIVVSSSEPRFEAVYEKPSGLPNLKIRHSSYTKDHALVTDAFQAAVAKARDLGWIE